MTDHHFFDKLLHLLYEFAGHNNGIKADLRARPQAAYPKRSANRMKAKINVINGMMLLEVFLVLLCPSCTILHDRHGFELEEVQDDSDPKRDAQYLQDIQDSPGDIVKTVTSAVPSVSPLGLKKTAFSNLWGHCSSGSGLEGNELILFPDSSFIYLHWSDITPMELRDAGTWYVKDRFIRLVSSRDLFSRNNVTGTDIFLFVLPKKGEQDSILLLMKGSPVSKQMLATKGWRYYYSSYSGFKHLLQYDDNDKMVQLMAATLQKQLLPPNWYQVAEHLFFWNLNRDDPEPKKKREAIPKNITWQEVKEVLRKQYTDPQGLQEAYEEFFPGRTRR